MQLGKLQRAASVVAVVSVLATALTLARGFDGGPLAPAAPVDRPAVQPPPAQAIDGPVPGQNRRLLRIRGSVVDADTGRPVQEFRVVPGYGNGRVPVWESGKAIPASGGSYEISLTREYRTRFVRIEARGYLAMVSVGFSRDAPEYVFDVRLHPGTGVGGIVRLPDGTPCAGADVVYGPPGTIKNGLPPAGPDYVTIKTGPDGRFAFPREVPGYPILILDDRGFAEQTADQLAAWREVTLQPWGRVEGTLRIGNRAGAGEIVSLPARPLDDAAERSVTFGSWVTADASGRFVLERVVPGEAPLWRYFQRRSQGWNMSLLTLIDVEPGATARVNVGGTGRPVIGRLIAPAAIAAWVDWSHDTGSWVQSKQRAPSPPPGLDGREQVRWRLAWEESEAGKAFRRAERRYGVKLARDGTFRVEDVEAGDYEMRILVDDEPPPAANQCKIGGLLGAAELDFRVPDIPGGRSDEPLDLGAITVRAIRNPRTLNVGDPAPAFRAETFDGNMLELAAYRGRFVLVCFWDITCDACLDETPHLKAVYEAFGRDERFAMCGVCFDASPRTVRSYAEEQGLHYAQGFVPRRPDLPDAYGIRGVPSIWLIGPDGRVVSRELRGEAIREAVATALARPR